MKRIEIVGENYLGHWTNSRTACRGIILQEGKQLLSYETLTNQWMIPGGGLENDETEAECCIREVAEETGTLVKASECLLEIDEYYGNERFISRYFLCEPIGTALMHRTQREISVGMEPRWLELGEILDIFSKHAEYTGTDEMRRGLYLREYTALQTLLVSPADISGDKT